MQTSFNVSIGNNVYVRIGGDGSIRIQTHGSHVDLDPEESHHLVTILSKLRGKRPPNANSTSPILTSGYSDGYP